MTIIDQLKRDEGFRSLPYRDSRGYLTIGYGINLDAGTNDEEATYWLSYRINQARTWMLSHFPWANALDDARFGALLNLSYNLGGKLLGFHKALSAFETGDYEGAAREFADSAWKMQVGDRATRLCEQIRTGVWQ